MSFTDSLNRFNDKVEKKATARLRKIAQVATEMVVLNTPVDTGTARANWRVLVGRLPREHDLTAQDKNGEKAINDATMVIQNATLGTDIYIGNSVPYIIRLEHGYSSQKPGGWVHTKIEEIKALIALGKL